MNKLHLLLNIAVAILVFVISLLILKITSTHHLLVFLGSELLLVGFVFKNSWKTAYEAIIFLFVTHPFDVGDRCEVDGVQVTILVLVYSCGYSVAMLICKLKRRKHGFLDV